MAHRVVSVLNASIHALLLLVLIAIAVAAGPRPALADCDPINRPQDCVEQGLSGQAVANNDNAASPDKLRSGFSEITKLILYISGSVMVAVLMVIGVMMMITKDSRKRAENMEWLAWAIGGSGLVFGGTLVVRIFAYIWTKFL